MALLAPRTTARLLLREFAPGDLDALFDSESRPEVARFLSRAPLDAAGAAGLLAEILADAGAEPRAVHHLAIVGRPAAGDLAGHYLGRLKLRRTGLQPGEAAAGYALHPRAWGQGVGQEATAALLDLAFDELAVRRAIAEVDPRNGPSIHLLERLGLRREAHHVQNAWIQDEWRDTLVYAVLAEEWRARSRRQLAGQAVLL